MARLRFLAVAYDPRPDHEGVVYGPGHETDFDDTDTDYVLQLRIRGYAEVLDASGLTPPALQRLGLPEA